MNPVPCKRGLRSTLLCLVIKVLYLGVNVMQIIELQFVKTHCRVSENSAVHERSRNTLNIKDDGSLAREVKFLEIQ